MKKKKSKKNKKEYSSIQISKEFKEELRKVKKKNHFDSYESTIKHLIHKKRGV